mgnify:CR=1 FL=1
MSRFFAKDLSLKSYVKTLSRKIWNRLKDKTTSKMTGLNRFPQLWKYFDKELNTVEPHTITNVRKSRVMFSVFL